MAEPGVVTVVDPTTGLPKTIPSEALTRQQAAAPGTRQLSDAELSALREQQAADKDLAGSALAYQSGAARGVGEAFNLPLDAAAIGTASLFGKGAETRKYLTEQQRLHPTASFLGEMGGQGAGFLIGGEALGAEAAGAKAATLAGRVAQGAGRAAVQGGVESLIAGSTHDLNEAALGNSKINGEKLFANAPAHIFWGATAGAAIGGVGAVAGEALAGVARHAPDMLESGANTLVGRELGLGAEAGAGVRAEMGRIPTSTREVAEVFGAKQAAFRRAAEVEHSAISTEMAGRQAAERASLSAAATEGKTQTRRMVDETFADIVKATQERRAEIAASRAGSLENAKGLAKEIKTNAEELKAVAIKLDRLPDVERPRVGVFRDALMDMIPAGADGTPVPLNKWIAGVQRQFGTEGSVPFNKMEGVIKSLDDLSINSADPNVKKMASHMVDMGRAEFDRASAMAASSNDVAGLNVESLRETAKQLEVARKTALESVIEHDGRLADFDTQAKELLSKAKVDRTAALGEMQAAVKQETDAQKAAFASEKQAVKGAKPGKTTPFDEVAGAAAQKAASVTTPISRASAFFALLSVLHGNLLGAGVTLSGSLVSGVVKGRGNLAAARVLGGLAGQFRKLDESIARGARSAVGALARESALTTGRQAERTVNEPAPSRLSFDKVATQVRQNAANPQALDARMMAQFGAYAKTAPNIYSSAYSTAQRAQDFLMRALPPERRDMFSPTAHLEPPSISDAEKYDFMLYVHAIANPVSTLGKVKNGTLTDREVVAVQEVYPDIYAEMKSAVQSNIAALQRPIDYERAIHVGTLFGVQTNEVMDPAFQKTQAQMFEERIKNEKIKSSSSSPKGPNARMSKANMSGSEKVESGEGY